MSERSIGRLFEITDFIDNARWGNKDNYNLINFYRQDLSDNVKLLTHWLCYITDRQMEFKRIWDVGGFVLSELVDNLVASRDLNLLNPQKPATSFFIKKQDYPFQARYKGDFKTGADNGKYLFVSKTHVGENTLLREYGYEPDTTCYFISRYYPSDYKSILFTYCVLKNYKFDLINYIAHVIEVIRDDPKVVKKLLFALFLLTYFDIGQPRAEDLNFERLLKKGEERAKIISDVLTSKKIIDRAFEGFIKEETIFKQKRAWCSLRDFIKSPEFSAYFKSAIDKPNFRSATILLDPRLRVDLELPGDVWNNNPKFINCILQGTAYRDSRLSFSQLLRTMYEENKDRIRIGYPEQFDITFDLVPRMCEQGNCKICPYGTLRGKATDINKICINQAGKYCTVLLSACNYKIDCVGQSCCLLNYIKSW